MLENCVRPPYVGAQLEISRRVDVIVYSREVVPDNVVFYIHGNNSCLFLCISTLLLAELNSPRCPTSVGYRVRVWRKSGFQIA